MIEKLKNFGTSLVGILTSIIGVLLIALKVSGILRKSAESKLETAETQGKSNVMDSKIEATKEEQKKLEANIDSISKDHEKALKDAQDKTTSEVEDFYKRK